MPTRFDHAIIAVRDLDAAVEQYRRLGFDAQPGGRHDSGGTYNALIRFGVEYLELLSIFDVEAAKASGARGQNILSAIEKYEASLIGFALATANIEEDATRFRGDADQLSAVRPMQRQRPDGQMLTWRVLQVGSTPWQRPWPFLIQWDLPDEQRLAIDKPGKHPDGAIGWPRLGIATHNLELATEVYRDQLGMRPSKHDTCSVRVAERVKFELGHTVLELLSPKGEGPVSEALANHGEGPFSLTLTVNSLEETREFLLEQKIGFEQRFSLKGVSRLELDTRETMGVPLTFVE